MKAISEDELTALLTRIHEKAITMNNEILREEGRESEACVDPEAEKPDSKPELESITVQQYIYNLERQNKCSAANTISCDTVITLDDPISEENDHTTQETRTTRWTEVRRNILCKNMQEVWFLRMLCFILAAALVIVIIQMHRPVHNTYHTYQ